VRRLALSALVLSLAGGVVVKATATKPRALDLSGTVVRVLAGDTLDVRLTKNGKLERVHVLGVASPAAGSCFTRQAADGTGSLVAGKQLTLTADRISRDRSGNLLAYAALPDGSDLGAQLLAAGLAQIDVWSAPSSRFLSYVPVQQQAEAAGKGMWTACGADLAVTLQTSAPSVSIGNAIAFTATVTNAGPLAARRVVLDLRPGGGAQLIAADASAGSCTTKPWVGTCTFAAIKPGGSATATFQVGELQLGTFSTRALVRFDGCVRAVCGASPLGDPNLLDDKTAALTTVHKPQAGGPPPTNCSPAYPTVCIPPPPPDLDCADIPYKNFEVLQGIPNADPHNLDGNKDGIGCQRDDY
jgi:endonuclease YncB( thermonuclease family)